MEGGGGPEYRYIRAQYVLVINVSSHTLRSAKYFTEMRVYNRCEKVVSCVEITLILTYVNMIYLYSKRKKKCEKAEISSFCLIKKKKKKRQLRFFRRHFFFNLGINM